ncbi:hypothetical protein [Actinomadura sp. B10D3]|uniref:hypothetical protein n=1 Tax=Actinomadura sp. B10D3 TaxID=3153557 RepID=UPI00325E8F83
MKPGYFDDDSLSQLSLLAYFSVLLEQLGELAGKSLPALEDTPPPHGVPIDKSQPIGLK